mmetsp:Transcript_90149/g.254232  ORF Transcript_90149/g.254232 Transcript_90149/m.254232 type:complete len:340 (+) Transcript_90149:1464-2483(+)
MPSGHAGAVTNAGAVHADSWRGPEVLPQDAFPGVAYLRHGVGERPALANRQRRRPPCGNSRPLVGLRHVRGGQCERPPLPCLGRGRPHARNVSGRQAPRHHGQLWHAIEKRAPDHDVLGHIPGFSPADGTQLSLRAPVHQRRVSGHQHLHRDPEVREGEARSEGKVGEAFRDHRALAQRSEQGGADDRLHERQDAGQGLERGALGDEHRHRCAAWRLAPDGAGELLAEISGRRHRRHGRHRCCCTWPGHQRRLPGCQLRLPAHDRGVRAADRPDRPHRAPRQRDHVHHGQRRRRMARRSCRHRGHTRDAQRLARCIQAVAGLFARQGCRDQAGQVRRFK